MNKSAFILILIFIMSLLIASAQLDLPAPPQAPNFEMPDTQEQVIISEPEIQTPQITREELELQTLQQLQQLQAQTSSFKSTIDTLNSENQRLKQELRLQSERKPRSTVVFYIIFFLSIAVNIILIAMYILKHTKHEGFHKPEPLLKPTKAMKTITPEKKPKKPERDVKELKEYLLNAAKQGMTFDEVHNILQKSGWPEDLIEKAYDEIQHGL